MELLAENRLIFASVFVAAFFGYLLVRRLRSPRMTAYHKEIEHILSSDQFKVKGRFE